MGERRLIGSRRRRHTVPKSLSWAMLAVALLIAGCGNSGESANVGNRHGGTDGFVALFGGSTADYEPARSPADLAASSDLVFSGSLEGFAKGRTYVYPGNEGSVPTVVMQARADKLLKGDLPEGSDGSVYIEIFGASDPAEWERRMPATAQAILYLAPLPTDATQAYPGSKIADDGASPPAGQPLFVATTPEGFFLEDRTSRSVIQPMDATAFPHTSLDQFQPDATEFPESRPDPTLGGGAG